MVFLTVSLCLLCAAVFGAAGWFAAVRRARAERSTLEARLYRLEKSAGRPARERLRNLQQRTGVVYLDGLVSSGSREVARLFDGGLAHASQGRWEAAARDWEQAGRQADASGARALGLLVACCRLMAGQREGARAAVEGVLVESARACDRPAEASCRFVMGEVEHEERKHAAARACYAASLRLWRGLGDEEMEGRAFAGMAEESELLLEWDAALEYHRAALRIEEESGDRARAAARYGAIGAILARQGRAEEALAAYEAGLSLARRAQDRAREAGYLAAAGELFLGQGDVRRAREALEKALRMCRDARKPEAEVHVLLHLAEAHRRSGEGDAALEYWERALELGRKLGERRAVAQGLAGVAASITAHGDFDRAEKLYEEAVGLDREMKDDGLLSRHLAGLARVMLFQHESGAAEQALREALEAGRRSRDAQAELAAAVEMGRALRKQGRADETIAMLDRYRNAASAAPEVVARLHAELGLGYLARHEPQAALVALKEAAKLQGSTPSRELGLTLVNLGAALSAGREREGGMRSIEDGLKLLHDRGTIADEVWALRTLAEVNRQQGSPDRARQNLDRALDLAREENDGMAEAECLFALGRLAESADDLARARSLLEQASRAFHRAGAEAKAKEVADEVRRQPRAGAGVRFLDEKPD